MLLQRWHQGSLFAISLLSPHWYGPPSAPIQQKHPAVMGIGDREFQTIPPTLLAEIAMKRCRQKPPSEEVVCCWMQPSEARTRPRPNRTRIQANVYLSRYFSVTEGVISRFPLFTKLPLILHSYGSVPSGMRVKYSLLPETSDISWGEDKKISFGLPGARQQIWVENTKNRANFAINITILSVFCVLLIKYSFFL